MRNWYFPRKSLLKSRGRIIHVGISSNRGSQYLQISEQRRSGKVYKILIPSDGGWAKLINLLQRFYASELQNRLKSSYNISLHNLPPPPCQSAPSFSRRSYADVVKGSGFYAAGKCKIVGQGKDKHIEVDSDGVQERRDLLGRSLFINFQSLKASEFFTADYIHSFREWAHRRWSIDDNYSMENRGNGSWILICPSIDQALRIKRLGQLKFKDFLVTVSEWKDHEEKYSNSDKWILVYGIPLHLKSINLLKSIGNFCGSFIEIDWSSWSLEFVRIRIMCKRDIPLSIPVRYASDQFMINIIPPPATYDAADKANGFSQAVQKSKSRSPVLPHRFSDSISRQSNPDLPLVNASQSDSEENKGEGVWSRRSVRRVWVRKEGPIWIKPSATSPANPPDVFSSFDLTPSSQAQSPLTQVPQAQLPLTQFHLTQSSPIQIQTLLDPAQPSAAFLFFLEALSFPNPLQSLLPFPFMFTVTQSTFSSFILILTLSNQDLFISNPRPPLELPLRLFPRTISPPPILLDSPSFPASPEPSSLTSHTSSDTDLFLASQIPESADLQAPSIYTDFEELPSPSCSQATEDVNWNFEAYPFDLLSLVESSVNLGHIFSLGHDEGMDSVEKVITENAKEVHSKKVRTPRSRLEMEIHRLGPQSSPPKGPRKSASRLAGVYHQ
ncbi:unnamed protein product [Linum trigynum]